MRCRECESLLWSYLDGELAEGQRRTVEAHVNACARCTAVFECLRAFPLQVGQLVTAAPPPDFTTRLMRRIEPLPTPHELAAESSEYRPFRGPGAALLALASAAAALLLGLFSTSALALLTGQRLASPLLNGNLPTPLNSISVTEALVRWSGAGLAILFTWPVLFALCSMVVVLSLLWFRAVAPRRLPDRRR